MSFFKRRCSENHLSTLDGVRGLSILLVICFHAFFFSQYAFESHQQFFAFSENLPWWLGWMRRGDLGVDIFFVLSAFLIGTQLFGEQLRENQVSLGRFYLKRFLRIYPVYFFALALMIIAKGWNWNILANVFAYNNLYDVEHIVIPWSWSLSVEIQFYLIFPLILLNVTTARKGLAICLAVLAISTTWLSYCYARIDGLHKQTMMDFILQNDKDAAITYLQYLYVSPLARAPAFVFGVIASWLWIYRQKAIQQHYRQYRSAYSILTIALLLICFALASFNIYRPYADMSPIAQSLYSANTLFGRAVFSAMVATILLVSMLPEHNGSFTKRFLAHPAWFPLAKGSYAMYLFHPYLLFAAYYLLHGEQKLTELSAGGLISLALTGIALSLCFSIFTYYFIEKWCCYSHIFRKRYRQAVVSEA